MRKYIEFLAYKHHSNGVIIDTNIMLVYIVGHYDINYISQFERTKDYCADDYKNMDYVLSHFGKKVITTHILAELSNLSKQAWKDKKLDYFNVFGKLLEKTNEHCINKDILLNLPLLPKLGVTDLGIIEAAKEFGCLIFTDDFPMSGYASKQGIDVLNFNHIRGQQWGIK